MTTLNQPAIADQEFAVLTDAETDEVSGGFIIAVAAPVQAAIEAEWAAHLGARRMQQLTAALLALRAITDPYADDVSQGGVSRRTRD